MGGQFDAPPPYFAGARLKKTCVLGLGSRKMGDSGRHPPKKKWPFCAKKKGLKMPILGQKQCFLGSGGQFDARPPYFARARLKKTCVAGLGSRKMGDATPLLGKWPFVAQKWSFFAQKWPKNAIFGPKTVFLGLGWSIQHPPTLFCRCWTKQNMCCRVKNLENR